jgi:hypothetical protein
MKKEKKSCRRCHGEKRKGDGRSRRESKSIRWGSEKRKKRKRKSKMVHQSASSCP